MSNRVWLAVRAIVVDRMMAGGCRRCCNGDRRDCSQRRLGIAEDVVARGCHSLLVCIGMGWSRGWVSLCS